MVLILLCVTVPVLPCDPAWRCLVSGPGAGHPLYPEERAPVPVGAVLALVEAAGAGDAAAGRTPHRTTAPRRHRTSSARATDVPLTCASFEGSVASTAHISHAYAFRMFMLFISLSVNDHVLYLQRFTSKGFFLVVFGK